MNGPPEAHAHTHTTSRCSTSVSRRGSMLSPLGGLTRRVLRLSLAASQRLLAADGDKGRVLLPNTI